MPTTPMGRIDASLREGYARDFWGGLQTYARACGFTGPIDCDDRAPRTPLSRVRATLEAYLARPTIRTHAMLRAAVRSFVISAGGDPFAGAPETHLDALPSPPATIQARLNVQKYKRAERTHERFAK